MQYTFLNTQPARKCKITVAAVSTVIKWHQSEAHSDVI